MRLLIALATYNEIDSLPSLIAAIHRTLPGADILVVDDNSPDGTGRWCEDRAATESRIHCLHRPKKLGLGTAAAAAFAWAIERRYDWMGTLDADGSHDPLHFRAMLDVIKADPTIDVVLGSRYIAGGRIEGWPWSRRLASRSINALARTWLGLATRDNSGAFRLYRVATLKKINGRMLRSRGYAYLEEIVWRLKKAGALFREVPITFRQRLAGRSKLNAREALAALGDLFRLRLSQ
jgi:dolichol-phosphate mannosyltransferase